MTISVLGYEFEKSLKKLEIFFPTPETQKCLEFLKSRIWNVFSFYFQSEKKKKLVIVVLAMIKFLFNFSLGFLHVCILEFEHPFYML